MLVARCSLISGEGGFVALAGDSCEDHGERATMPRGGQVRISSVDRHAVMRNSVTRLKRNGDFPREIFRRVVCDAL